MDFFSFGVCCFPSRLNSHIRCHVNTNLLGEARGDREMYLFGGARACGRWSSHITERPLLSRQNSSAVLSSLCCCNSNFSWSFPTTSTSSLSIYVIPFPTGPPFSTFSLFNAAYSVPFALLPSWRYHAGLEYHYQQSGRYPLISALTRSKILQGNQRSLKRLSVQKWKDDICHARLFYSACGLAKDRHRTNTEKHHQMLNHLTTGSSCWRVSLAVFFSLVISSVEQAPPQ